MRPEWLIQKQLPEKPRAPEPASNKWAMEQAFNNYYKKARTSIKTGTRSSIK